MIVVADTTPLNFLVLIGEIEILRELFGSVLIPKAVFDELQNSETPEPVRRWIAERPSWLEIRPVQECYQHTVAELDPGEQEALALAEEMRADWTLLDEKEARQEAERRRLRYIGTLGVLREAAVRQLINLPEALGRLQKTSFYVSSKLIAALLDEDRRRRAMTNR